jgi:hypothetical protein
MPEERQVGRPVWKRISPRGTKRLPLDSRYICMNITYDAERFNPQTPSIVAQALTFLIAVTAKRTGRR